MALRPAANEKHEHERIETLEAYSVLNAESDADFDDIVRVAAAIGQAPMAFINFIDREQLWNKAAFGRERLTPGPRDDYFCNRTIAGPGIWEVEDASRDPSVQNHSSVVNAPYVRWYVGVPLLSPFGYALGTLCLVDFQARRLTENQKAALEACSRQVVMILEQRRQNQGLLKAQGEVLKAKNSALDLLRTKRDFIAQVSHEIRTPLNVVLGIATLMLDSELNGKQREYMINTRRSAQHILRLLNNVLDQSKLDAGKFTIEQKPFSLEETLDDLVGPLALLAKQKNLNLQFVNRCEDLPLLEGDALRLSQVLVNIIHNAIKFTDKGWIKINVARVEEKQGRALLQFEVSDSGRGLTADDCQRIFQAYQQVNASHAIDGSGLGLSIAKKLVESMNGQIGVTSNLGMGSTFWVMIPFVCLAKRIPRPIDRDGDKASFDGNVLLVEDDFVNAEITAQCLRSFGLTVHAAPHAADALQAVARQSFDLVLLDYHLPDSDGASLGQALRERLPAGTPIIALTGQERSASCSMDDYIQKPFERAALKAAIQSWVETDISSDEAEASQEALDKIRLHSPEDFVPKLIRGFLLRNPAEIRKMQDAYRNEDWKALGFFAHAMKSSLASFGIFSLADVCRKMERQMEEEGDDHTDAWDDIQALKKGLFPWYRHLNGIVASEQKAAS